MFLLKIYLPLFCLLTLNYKYGFCQGEPSSALKDGIEEPAIVQDPISSPQSSPVNISNVIDTQNITQVPKEPEQNLQDLNVTESEEQNITVTENVTETVTEPILPAESTTSNETSQTEVATVVVTPPPIQCPAECKCAATLVDAICTDRGLQQVPTGLSSRVKMLILTSNEITEIEEDTFKERNLYDLLSLLMNHNKIRTLHPNAFVILKHLEVLDLGDNSLTTLDPNLFFYNTALITLRLDSNTNLEIPEEGILFNSTTLHELNISSCNIRHFSEQTLSGTPALDTIDLSGNPLQDLDPNLFKNLPVLIQISLPSSIASKALELCKIHSKLQRVYISGNENSMVDCTKIAIETTTIPSSSISVPISSDRTKIIDMISNLTNIQAVVQNNVNSTIDKTADLINPNVRIPPAKLDKIVLPNPSSKLEEPATSKSTSSGLTGEQIDNLIIGALLTVIAVTLIAIIVNLNKKRLVKRRFKHQRRSNHTSNEPEGEPLQNMASNP